MGVLVPAGGDHELAPIELEQGAVLTGRVVDPDGRGIGGAELELLAELGGTFFFDGAGPRGSPLATSAHDGAFESAELPAGGFRILVRHPEHPDALATGRVERAGERLDGFTVVMDHGLTIAGRLVGAPADALGSLVVRALPERQSRMAAAEAGDLSPEVREAEPVGDGTFLVRGVRAGLVYELHARRRTSSSGLAGLLGTSLSARVPATAGDRGVEIVYQPSGALLFQVVDAGSGAPIPEFEARAGVSFLMPMVDDDGRPVRAHPEGRARFGNLRPGPDERVQLAVSAVGYRETLLEDLTVPLGTETDLGTVALEPIPLVEVTVLDARSGGPVPGARVTLAAHRDEAEAGLRMTVSIDATSGDPDDLVMEREGASTATTDEDGVARLSSLDGTAGTLTVRHPDFAPLESEPFTSPLTGTDRHTLELTRGGAVVCVLTTPDGAPLAGARIEHQAPGEDGIEWGPGRADEPITDAEGRARFEHLAPGAHRFRPAVIGARGMGFMGAGGGVVRMRRSGGAEMQDDSWTEVLVTEGGDHELALTAPVRVAVSGIVYEGGRALEGAKLALRAAGDERDPLMAHFGGGGPEARADGRGQYRLENVEAGEYELEITHPSRRMPARFELTVADEDLVRDYDLVVSVLEGRVTDEEGSPLEGVRVFPERVTDDSGPQATVISVMAFAGSDGGGEVVTVGDGSLGQTQATTDADGRYELRGVEPDVDLVVRAEGESVQPGRSEVVRVAPDQTRSGVDLALAQAGRIEVLATNSRGEPARNLVVTALYEGQVSEGEDVPRETGFIQNSGRHVLDGLIPGPWRVTLRTIGGLGGSSSEPIPDQLIDVVVGEAASASFAVP